MIDMSDLEDLDDISLDLDEPPGHTETISSEPDTAIMTRPPAPMAERPSESASPDITFELSDTEDDESSTPSVPLETADESAADDIFETAVELELETGEERRSAEPEADLQIDLDTFDLSDDDEEDRPKQSSRKQSVMSAGDLATFTIICVGRVSHRLAVSFLAALWFCRQPSSSRPLPRQS
jgi:hypothetical protein